MGGKKTVNNTTTESQTRAPPSYALPGMEALASKITSMIPGLPIPAYTGEFIAGPNQLQTSALPLFSNASNLAIGAAGQIGDAAGQLMNIPGLQGPQLPSFGDGGAINFGGQSMPAFEQWETPRFDTTAAAEAATAPLLRNLTERILPGMRSSALASGAYGNSRMMEVLPSLAIRDTMRNAQEIGTGLAYDEHKQAMADRLAGYGMTTQRGLGSFGSLTERGLGEFAARTQRGLGEFGALTERGLGEEQLRQAALRSLPTMLSEQVRMATGAGDILTQAGALQQSWDQGAINNALARQDYLTRAPFAGLDVATQLLSGLANGYGTSTGTSTSKTVERSGGMAPILGGIMGLGSLALGMPGGIGGISSLFGGRGGGAPSPIIPTPGAFYGW